MSESKVRITLSLFDSGCLPTLLAARIAEVERALPHAVTGEQQASAKALLKQLKGCQAAVLAARDRAAIR